MTIAVEVSNILSRATVAAADYYRLTGKPLGITGEIGECIAAACLGLKLTGARTAGYDSTDDAGRRIQIKTRCVVSERKATSQRVGSIRLAHDWDAVLLVLIDHAFQPLAIYEAERAVVTQALTEPGSKARNERGALSISKFKSIGKKVWPEPGVVMTMHEPLDDFAIDMFHNFARFEYSLKAAGFHNGDGPAEANWRKFAEQVAALFRKTRPCRRQLPTSWSIRPKSRWS